VLDAGKLMTWATNADPTCIADISADQVTTMQAASMPERWAWESSQTAPKTKGGPTDARKEAIADLCHAVINSNEFFYLH
jgi:hypothetical protein